uniref:polyubiquitin 8-like n=1 Tax=Erigeron canadensis TaxID=72917 RepID=UPI001CB99BA3|nr:polyubiquitin 8-like [Erigeron canadensis]
MQLSLRTANGGTICLEVNNLDTLDSVRATVTDMGYRVCNWHIKSWDSPQIFVLVGPDQKKTCLEYNPSDTVSDLKTKTGLLPDQYILFFAGMVLEKSSPISHYNISRGSTLNLVTYFGGYMTIFVVTNSGKTISMLVHGQFSARLVKKMIKDQIGYLDGQRLVNVYAGQELLDQESLSVLEEGATLHLVDDARTTSRIEMKIHVKIFLPRKTIELDVVNFDTINHVKHMIPEKEHIPIGLQVLYLPQKRLENTFTLAHYYIFNETTLYLAQIPAEYHRIPEALNKEGDLPKTRLSARSSSRMNAIHRITR